MEDAAARDATVEIWHLGNRCDMEAIEAGMNKEGVHTGEGLAVATEVEQYLKEVPEEARVALEKLRETIKSAAPDTTETISYQMPTFKYRGRSLVGYAAFKDHCSFFPYSGKVMDDLADEIGALRTSKGTIRFTVDKPLPRSLVKKVVEARVQEIDNGLAR